jgi:hypothetical protein
MAFLRPAAAAGWTIAIRFARLPFVVFAAIVACVSAIDCRAQSEPNEYQVKAAYLLNFARFVEWPPAALPASSPLDIVIVGVDSFGGALEEVLRGKSANGHAIQLRHMRWNDILTPY